MHILLRIPALCALLVATALAQTQPTPAASPTSRPTPTQDQPFYYHYEWTRGAVLTSQEWKRGVRIAPRRHNLEPSPPGYEWREIDRNYVLVSSSTHAIARVFAAPHPTIPGGGEP